MTSRSHLNITARNQCYIKIMAHPHVHLSSCTIFETKELLHLISGCNSFYTEDSGENAKQVRPDQLLYEIFYRRSDET